MRLAPFTGLLAWACGSALCLAAEPASQGHAYSLFDGQSLDGWTIENDCEVEVQDGMILLKKGNGWLRSDHVYSDFKLHIEWKALQEKNFDAGVYLRAGREGQPWPRMGYQVNTLQGQVGNVRNLPGAEVTDQGLVKPAGEWNSFDITVVGETVSLEINGRPVWKADGAKVPLGHIGIQVEEPKGGQFLLRNITVTELRHRSLFNGKDFTGWDGAGGSPEANWEVKDGILTVNSGGPWLRSREEYGDFNLRLEYLVSAGANSGVYVRVPESGNHRREDESKPPAGFEVQILDDYAEKHAKLKDFQYSGSVYGIAGPTQRVTKPAGEWNTLEINCRGPRVTVVQNGVVIVKASADEHPPLALRQLRGYLGLQAYSGGGVSFRNLRVGPPMPGYP